MRRFALQPEPRIISVETMFIHKKLNQENSISDSKAIEHLQEFGVHLLDEPVRVLAGIFGRQADRAGSPLFQSLMAVRQSRKIGLTINKCVISKHIVAFHIFFNDQFLAQRDGKRFVHALVTFLGGLADRDSHPGRAIDWFYNYGKRKVTYLTGISVINFIIGGNWDII